MSELRPDVARIVERMKVQEPLMLDVYGAKSSIDRITRANTKGLIKLLELSTFYTGDSLKAVEEYIRNGKIEDPDVFDDDVKKVTKFLDIIDYAIDMSRSIEETARLYDRLRMCTEDLMEGKY